MPNAYLNQSPLAPVNYVEHMRKGKACTAVCTYMWVCSTMQVIIIEWPAAMVWVVMCIESSHITLLCALSNTPACVLPAGSVSSRPLLHGCQVMLRVLDEPGAACRKGWLVMLVVMVAIAARLALSRLS